jgi:hypothetical protein
MEVDGNASFFLFAGYSLMASLVFFVMNGGQLLDCVECLALPPSP